MAFLRKPTDVSTLTVKLKKCKAPGCRKEYVPRSSWQKACSPECVVKLSVTDAQKAVSEAAKASRAQDRAKRTALKTRSDWMKEAQVAFNAYIRERDKDKPCICCGRTSEKQYLTGTNWDCGHYRSTGSAPQLRFHEDNAHRQLTFCNRDRAGNAVDYRVGLIARIGLARVEALEADQEPRKYTIAELQEIKETYKAKLKAMKVEPVKWTYLEGDATDCAEPEWNEEDE